MADFSDIPKGIARKIAFDHLDNLEDVESFGQVCTSWRSETRDVNYTNFWPSKNTQHPWLMLADSPTSSYRRLYSVSKGMYAKIDLPIFDDDPEDCRRYFSSHGWLIAVSMKRGLITFYDPFSATATVINPPSVPTLAFIDGDGEWDDEYYLYQFSKFIFSNDNRRDDNKEEDFQVAMIFKTLKYIAFWRPGHKKWVQPIMGFDNIQVEDACFFRGEFYAIDHYSQVIAYGSEEPIKRLPRIVANLCSQGVISEAPWNHYIVVSGTSTLLVINRDVNFAEDNEYKEYWTESFELAELTVDTGEAKRVEDIGNRALFVGHSSTFFVEAESLQRGCRPNCIYFTDDNSENYCCYNSSRGGGGDMGIYSLEEKRVVSRVYEGPSQFSYETPPMWVELPHC